jgi:ketosteroid isomerase-like protein
MDKPSGPIAIWLECNEALNRNDHVAASRLMHPDVVAVANGQPAVASTDDDRAIQQELVRCFPDFKREFTGGLESGNEAVVEWRMRGTAAPGVGVDDLDVPGCSIISCEDGRLRSARLYHPTGVLDVIAERALHRER